MVKVDKPLWLDFLLRNARGLGRKGSVLQFDEVLWMRRLFRGPFRGRTDRTARFAKDVGRRGRESGEAGCLLPH